LLENYKDILYDDKNILNEYSWCAELKLWHNGFEYKRQLSEHSEKSKITITDSSNVIQKFIELFQSCFKFS